MWPALTLADFTWCLLLLPIAAAYYFLIARPVGRVKDYDAAVERLYDLINQTVITGQSQKMIVKRIMRFQRMYKHAVDTRELDGDVTRLYNTLSSRSKHLAVA